MKLEKYFCYIYLDPRHPDPLGKFENEPIYVGIGAGNRHLDHLRRKDVHPFTAKLCSLKKNNLKPLIRKLHENLCLEDAKAIEKNLIASIGRKVLGEGTLLNISGGGEGNFDPPPEVRKKLASYGMLGKKHTEEVKKQIGFSNSIHPTMKTRGSRLGKSNLGKISSIETKAKISKSISGEKNPRSKEWTINCSNGETLFLKGNLKEWCRRVEISYYLISKRKSIEGKDGLFYTLMQG